MPYHIVKHGEKFCVEKQDGSKSFGCHPSEEKAKKQLAALYANEPKVAEARELHLLGATGQVRTELVNGKEHLVVPVVALMEGVIHAVNAAKPEFVPLEVLKKGVTTWDGKPVTLGHPQKDGKHCSANDPAILASHGIGIIRNSRVEGKKFLCEALIDKIKTKQLHPDMYSRLLDGESEEVSVGALVLTDKEPGEYNGKWFQGSWIETSGDHLAFLPGGRGACSLEMGCGTHRAAVAHLVTAEGFQMDSIEEELFSLPGTIAFTTLEGTSLSERISLVQDAVWKEYNTPPEPYVYCQAVFDDHVIVRKGEDTYSVAYTIDKDGAVVLGTATKVKMAYVAAAEKSESCTACEGTGKIAEVPCGICDGKGGIRAAAGSRHSASDKKMIQAVHDHAMALGAMCDRSNYAVLEDRFCRTISQAERDKIPAEDFAGPHRSFFIVKPEDVTAAARLVGHAQNPDAVKAKIVAIAYRKGSSFISKLPNEWKKKADQRAAASDPNRYYIERIQAEVSGGAK